MSARIDGLPQRSSYLTWTVHLARQQPKRAAIAVSLIMVSTLAVALAADNAFWPLLTVAFLFFSLNDFFLPISYTLDDRGITAAGLVSRRFMDWNSLRKISVSQVGVKVSPLSQASRFEPFRGIFLHCTGETRSQVVSVLQLRLAAPDDVPEAA